MSKYIETPIAAAVYQRCHQITITNPYKAAPVVTFEEEQILTRADGTVLHDMFPTPVSKVFADSGYAFPIYDPTTQLKTGQTATVAQVYAMIWSVYMFEATKRDAQKEKDAVLSAFEVSSMAAMASVIVAAKAVRDAFLAQNVVDLATAEEAMAAAATPAESQAVLTAYDIARAEKLAASEAAANALVNDQRALTEVQRALAAASAQAAYDAVMAL